MATYKELKKVSKWYHATTLENAEKIIADGFIKPVKHNRVYLANSIDGALMYMSMRGLNDNLVVFTIKRHDLDRNNYFDNTADLTLKSLMDEGHYTLAYLGPIDISRAKYKQFKIDKPMNAPPGCSFVHEDGKIGIQLDDITAFEKDLQDHWEEYSSLIEVETGVKIQDFETFKSILPTLGMGDNLHDMATRGYDRFTDDLKG